MIKDSLTTQIRKVHEASLTNKVVDKHNSDHDREELVSLIRYFTLKYKKYE